MSAPLSRLPRPVWGACLALLLALSACGQKQDAQPAGNKRPTAVGVMTVSPEAISLTTELPGRTTAPLAADIRPQVDGIVQTRCFTEGSKVKAGEVLYQLDPASYQATYNSAAAAVQKAEATVELDKINAQRQAALARIDAVSQQDNQTAQATLKQDIAALATAKAALDTARINLERTAIKSPITGLVDISAVTPGALVTASQTTALTTVRQIDPIQVDVTRSSAELLRMKNDLAAGKYQRVGQDTVKVKLLLEDGSTYVRTGKLKFSGVSVNTTTGAITLRAVFDNPDGLLLPGMYVRAVIDTASANQAILVPQQAVSRDLKGNASVLVVDEQNKVVPQPIVTDRQVGNRWLVGSGLKGGEHIIVEGNGKVRTGDTVQAQPVAAASAPAAH